MHNTLYYGDNLPILREHLADESVDLVYLDPPFNSNRSYNVLFRDESGVESDAQIQAFDDTWHWNNETEAVYNYLVTDVNGQVGAMIGADAGAKKGKKGADQGVDGVINFIDDSTSKPKRALVQVKSGHVKAGDVRDLHGTVDREKAQIGVFVTLEEPSAPMITEAAAAGFYHSPGWNQDYPRIQILTVAQLLAGATPQMPPAFGTFKQAPRERADGPEQGRLV